VPAHAELSATGPEAPGRNHRAGTAAPLPAARTARGPRRERADPQRAPTAPAPPRAGPAQS